MLIVLTIGVVGCGKQANIMNFEDLRNGEIDDGTEVTVKGKAAFINEVDKEGLKKQGVTEFDIEGPTQMVLLVNENNISLHVYNELSVTNKEVEKDEEVIVKGKYYGEEADAAFQATEIN